MIGRRRVIASEQLGAIRTVLDEYLIGCGRDKALAIRHSERELPTPRPRMLKFAEFESCWPSCVPSTFATTSVF
jgi:hypothetical protein